MQLRTKDGLNYNLAQPISTFAYANGSEES